MGTGIREDPTEAEGARLLFAQRSHGSSRGDHKAHFSRVRRMVRHCVQHEPLLLATLAGVAVGLVLGIGLSFANLSPLALEIIGLPGDLLMRTLKMLVLPLITASVMAGVCALRQSTADMGKVARYTLLYYFSTTMGAVVLGIVIVNVVKPGRGSPFDQFADGGASCHAANQEKVASHTAAAGQRSSPAEAFLGVIKSAFPDNVFQAAATMNVLGIITVSLLMGAALSSLEPEAAPMVKLINIFNEAIGKIVNWVIWTSPVGIASLITTSICRACNLAGTLVSLGLFILAVLVGLLLWGFVVLPIIYFVTTRRNPAQVYRGFSQAMATAFGTDSSNATLPITMRSAVALGCDPRIVQFFLPLGTTVNMNGTALYEAVTVIFIAQAHGVVLGAAGTVIVALTATLAAVGAAGIPSAGLVTMLMVLQAVDLEQFSSDIAIILAVDWFLDRCRTVVNVLGDSFGTVIIDHHARNWVPQPSGTELSSKDPKGASVDGLEVSFASAGGGATSIEMGAAVVHASGGGNSGRVIAAVIDAADVGSSINSCDTDHHRSHHRSHHHSSLFHQLHGKADGVRQGLLAAVAEPAEDDDDDDEDGSSGSAAKKDRGAPISGDISVRHYLQAASSQSASPLQDLPIGVTILPPDGNVVSASGVDGSRLYSGLGSGSSGPMGHIGGSELHHRHPHTAMSSSLSAAVLLQGPVVGHVGHAAVGSLGAASLEPHSGLSVADVVPEKHSRHSLS